MSTIFREWSYRYAWVYNTVSWLAALNVGGIDRLHRLFLQENSLTKETFALDLCCGSGPITRILLEFTPHVTALDASPKAIDRARQKSAQANYVVAFAEKMPFPDKSFDFVITHTACHEMTTDQLTSIIQEVKRVLRPQGRFVIVDFHPPQNPFFWLPVSIFLYLFETETAWQWLKTDLDALLATYGFVTKHRHLYAGGSLQVLTCTIVE